MVQKELFALFGNGHRDNIIFTLNAGESMVLNFKDNGVDSTSDKYYDLKSEAKKVSITVNKVAVITHINGQELKSPKTLGTSSMNVFSSGIEWGKMTVYADVNATVFEIYAS